MPDFSHTDQLIKGPKLIRKRNRTARPVEQQQVDIVSAKLAKALIDRWSEPVRRVVADPDLGSQEDFRSGYTGISHAKPDVGFVRIDLRGIAIWRKPARTPAATMLESASPHMP
ncbi:hypothetical protein RM96_20350 [Cupriavidus sp. IDO]|nr:hypothetical protein RM96_20350 [Cupriavidus sp. IDO]